MICNFLRKLIAICQERMINGLCTIFITIIVRHVILCNNSAYGHTARSRVRGDHDAIIDPMFKFQFEIKYFRNNQENQIVYDLLQ